jgi:hypothetical protein
VTAQPWEPSVARLEGIVEQIDKRLDSIDRRLESMGTRLESKIEDVRSTLDGKIDRLQWRMTSLILGTWISTMLAVLALFIRK